MAGPVPRPVPHPRFSSGYSSLHHWFSRELERREESPPPICSFMVAMCLCKKPHLNLRRTLGCESTPWSPSLILTNTEPVTHPSASHVLASTAAHAACTEVTLLSPTLKLSHEAPNRKTSSILLVRTQQYFYFIYYPSIINSPAVLELGTSFP